MISQYKILPRVLPFAIYILFLALGDYLSQLLHGLNVDDKWLYVFRVAVVALLIVYFWRDFTELNIKPKVIDFLIALVAGILVLLIWILPFPSWAMLGVTHTGFNPLKVESSQAAYFWISTRILGAALVVPVMEELFWRSFLMRWIDNKNFLNLQPEKISLFAYLAISTLFAIEHNLWLAGFLAGLVYGALYIKYKNLWVPILAHATTNGLLGIWVVKTNSWQYW